MGGDFNVPLTPSQDTFNGSSSMTYRAPCAIKTQLSNLTLHDMWRTLHPNVKDFTFFSPPHNKYSRIDHLYLPENDLTFLTGATIEPMLLSDHHPITMTLTLPLTRTMSAIWRLDYSLLMDLENTHDISKLLSQYFAENVSDDTSPTVTWAVHKCIIRGKLYL